jgi:hypothetical protein
MRRLVLVALIALIGVVPFTASAQAPVQAPTAKTDYVYPLVLAVGALAGVVSMNALTYGVGTLPLAVGIPTTAPIVSPAAAAASRIFVITSGVTGAWIASWLYGK